MKNLLTTILFLFNFAFIIAQVSTDSIKSRRSLFIIPSVAYQQETSIAPGLSGGYYFKSNDLSRISSIAGSAIYTFKNQFIFNITPRLYLRQGKCYLYSNFNFRNYPDYYYGIGNQTGDRIKQQYTERTISVTLQPLYEIFQNLFVGGTLSLRHQEVKTDESFVPKLEYIFNTFGDAGWNPFTQLNIGAVAMYDKRDNAFYPYSGMFVKSTLIVADKMLSSTFSLRQFQLDFRYYLPLFKDHVLATQLLFDGVYGNEIPFQLLPTVGGRDVIRGFRQGMYRDNTMIVFQTEYRLPIYKRLKAAIFCGTGDVMNGSDFKIDQFKFAYGGGLRYRLNDARVHLRVDLAKNNYGDKLQFYITASEAF